MAYTLVRQNTNYDSTGSTSITVTLPSVTAGSGLVLSLLIICSSGTNTVSSVTDSVSNTWVKANLRNSSSTSVGVYYVSSSKLSSSTLTVTLTVTGSTASYLGVNLSQWSQALILRSNNYVDTTTASTTPTGPSLASVSADLVIGVLNPFVYDGNTINASSPSANLTYVAARTSGIYPAYALATTTTTAVKWTASTSTGYIVSSAVFHAPGYAKWYNGSSWVGKPAKWYNGSSWVIKPVKRYNGSAWVVTNY